MRRYLMLGIVALSAIALIAMLSACGRHQGRVSTTVSNSAGGSGQRFRVGVTLLDEDDAFYQELKQSMKQAAAANNIDLTIVSADRDLARQTDQVSNFITQQMQAIIVCPVQTDGVAGAIRRANAAGIPVFTADIEAHGGKVVCHVASNNVQGGELAAKEMIKLLHGKGNIAIIDFPEVTSVRDRSDGFKKEIATAPGIHILADPSGGGMRDRSKTLADNLITQYGKKLNGIFGINDNTALGALDAVEQNNRPDIVIVGYDGSPEARQDIKSGGPLKADAVQYPAKIGKKVIGVVAQYLKGDHKVPPIIQVQTGLVTAANLK